MNYYYWFVTLFGIGIITVFVPLLSSMFFQYELPIERFIVYFGVGSALMGGGIGCGVCHLVYRKDKGAKNVE